MDRVETIVIGAGVIGLACARSIARRGREVVVLESEAAIGSGISSRSSEVIHAGIYYDEGSLKARLCVQGKKALYRYCEARGIPHRRTGKLIVACTTEELEALEDLSSRARANGVDDLELISARKASKLEPELQCKGALLSPSTGIIDSHSFMLGIRGEAEDHGVMIAFGSTLESVKPISGGYRLGVATGRDEIAVECSDLINAAGLQAWSVARSIDGFDDAHIPPQHFSKGCYFALGGRAPFTRLIYPVPVKAGLGIHLTLDMGGQARFGPDAEWVESIDYDVPDEKRDAFANSIRRYYPDLDARALQPAYAGIRPKIQGPGERPADFVVSGPADHGREGLINLFGIESPGLTASLALGDYVADLLTGGG